MSNISSKDYVPTLLKSASSLASRSNSIPTGEDYAFALLDPNTVALQGQVHDKLQSILTMLVQFITPETCAIDYEDIVEASDKCLEHVAITLDNLKNPSKALPKISNYDLAKPKLDLKSDNSTEPFTAILTYKPNSIVPLELSPSQPYLPELEKLIYSSDQLRCSLGHFDDMAEETFTYIDTKEKLEKMIGNLNSAEEIAVDLEHHNFRSYQGFTCLLQISTREHDYVIDPFPIWNDLHLLLGTFTNPNIVKVLHGADSDMLWLQRDFGLYIVNMFDTGQAARKLMFSRFGLGFLLEQICEVKTDKSFQLADWRVRPLSEEHLKYARMDTHYLLYIYDYLKVQLQSKAAQLKVHPLEYIKDVLNKSKEICMKMYVKPDLTYLGINSSELLDRRQRRILENVAKWRDLVAREEDESPAYVLGARKVMMLVTDPPEDLKALAKIAQNANFVKKHGEKVLKVIKEAVETIEEQPEKIKVFEVKPTIQTKPAYIKRFHVKINVSQRVSYFYSANQNKLRTKYEPAIAKIKNSLSCVFNTEKSCFFNKAKPKTKEIIKKPESKPEELPTSLQEKYQIPMKHTAPVTRKLKQNLVKKQKISEKKAIKVGWMDNIELQPVKRKNLFKKSHK